MERTVVQKMGLVTGSVSYLINPPENWLREIAPLKLRVKEKLSGEFDYLHLFAMNKKELQSAFPKLKNHLKPNGKLWISWPKAGKLGTALNMKEVIRIGYDTGLVESKMLKIDETWTALKFTFPVEGKIYHNSFGILKP